MQRQCLQHVVNVTLHSKCRDIHSFRDFFLTEHSRSGCPLTLSSPKGLTTISTFRPFSETSTSAKFTLTHIFDIGSFVRSRSVIDLALGLTTHFGEVDSMARAFFRRQRGTVQAGLIVGILTMVVPSIAQTVEADHPLDGGMAASTELIRGLASIRSSPVRSRRAESSTGERTASWTAPLALPLAG